MIFWEKAKVAYSFFYLLAVSAFFFHFQLLLGVEEESSAQKDNIQEELDCSHVYAITRNRPMDRCPRCGTLNDAVRT